MSRRRVRARKEQPDRYAVSIERVPEALAAMRTEIATLLREQAKDEEPGTAARLREIAAVFETGQTEDIE